MKADREQRLPLVKLPLVKQHPPPPPLPFGASWREGGPHHPPPPPHQDPREPCPPLQHPPEVTQRWSEWLETGERVGCRPFELGSVRQREGQWGVKGRKGGLNWRLPPPPLPPLWVGFEWP